MGKSYILIGSTDGRNFKIIRSFHSLPEAIHDINLYKWGFLIVEGNMDCEYFGSYCEDYYSKMRKILPPFLNNVSYGVEITNENGQKKTFVVYAIDD